MATTIRISAKLEAELRAAHSLTSLVAGVGAVVALLDKAQAKKAVGALAVKPFVDIVKEYRPVVLPQHADKEAVYSRLTKALQRYGVTTEHAHVLGSWLKAQTWLHDITLEHLTRCLGEWLSRASASRPAFKPSVWAESDK